MVYMLNNEIMNQLVNMKLSVEKMKVSENKWIYSSDLKTWANILKIGAIVVAAEIEVFGKSKFKSQHHGYDQLERKSIRQTHD